MALFGAHMSIAGGFHKAVEAAAALDMETVQIFTHSPSQWAVKPVAPAAKSPRRGEASQTKSVSQWVGKPLAEADIQHFKKLIRQFKVRHPTAHDSYLINLASPNGALYRQSVDAFAAEIERAEALGLSYLVMHPGTPTDGDDEAGLNRIALAFNEVHHRTRGCRVKVLLETTAGQGKSLGHRFEHLAAIRNRVAEPERLGVCLDTCHVFAAGYPLAPESAYRATFEEFDAIVGLTHLKAFHVNDSLKPQGSRVDRHAAIGKGCLGLEPFRLLVNDRRFAKVPMIMETPKEGTNGEPMDPVNLAVLRDLVKG